MKNFEKIINEDKIIYRNNIDNEVFTFVDYRGKKEYLNCYDVMYIKRKYDLNFLNYVIKDIKKNKIVPAIFVSIDSSKIDNIILKNKYKVKNISYLIKNEKNVLKNNYIIIDSHESNTNFFKCGTKNISFKGWKTNDEYTCNFYHIDNKLVGAIEYKFIKDKNRIWIREIVSDNEEFKTEMIKDLLNKNNVNFILVIPYYMKDLYKDISCFKLEIIEKYYCIEVEEEKEDN